MLLHIASLDLALETRCEELKSGSFVVEQASEDKSDVIGFGCNVNAFTSNPSPPPSPPNVIDRKNLLP
jgi:hypothetical protein